MLTLGHLLKYQQQGAVIELDRLPLSEALLSNYSQQQAYDWALGGGEDFELCFTVPAEREAELKQRLNRLDLRCSRVGWVTAEPDLIGQSAGGQRSTLSASGYRHF